MEHRTELQGYGEAADRENMTRSRRNAGFSMIELLVSITLLSVMTAVLLQSFIVARRLNARVSTEQKIQTLALTTMESMKAAYIDIPELRDKARYGGKIDIDGINYDVEYDSGCVRLIYNDIGNGRGPVVSFGKQYGVSVEFDTTPYEEKQRINSSDRSELVSSFNNWDMSSFFPGNDEKLAQLRVVIYRMDERLAKSGDEQLILETARYVHKGG